jgi:hypothetical protein
MVGILEEQAADLPVFVEGNFEALNFSQNNSQSHCPAHRSAVKREEYWAKEMIERFVIIVPVHVNREL